MQRGDFCLGRNDDDDGRTGPLEIVVVVVSGQ